MRFRMTGLWNGKWEFPETIQKKILQYKNHFLFCRCTDLHEIPEESDSESFLPPVYLSAGSSLMKITDNAVKFFIQIIETQNHKAGNKYNNGNPHKTESDRKQCGR